MATQDIDLATRTSGDPFPAFDPHKDIGIGSFVAMCSPEHERRNGATFYVGKVCALNYVANAEGIIQVIWYWPKMSRVEAQMHLANGTNSIQVVCIVRGYRVGNLMIGFLLTVP